MLYNIRYGTGCGLKHHLPLPFCGFLLPTGRRFGRIADLIASEKPDIVALVEADGGSWRHGGHCQAGRLARHLGFESIFIGKYGSGCVADHTPLLRHQGNAVVAGLPWTGCAARDLGRGFKRSLLEVDFGSFLLQVVHLSLGKTARREQIRRLGQLCREKQKPVILAGDCNTFSERETGFIEHATGLTAAGNPGEPTWPSRHPRRALDHVFASPGIKVTDTRVIRTKLSDHLPVVCEFETTEAASGKERK
ncbi:MAG: endonuclease/exonuclease/phosphatase family protein [Synergistota bacterium]|nr:endonuclease/exonuclease/phosphatase family protein [Synergistota bacterium]